MNGTLKVGGGVTFWSLGKMLRRSQLANGWTPLGLESFVPEERTPLQILKSALRCVFPRAHLRPIKGEGYAVKETHPEDFDSKDTHVVTVRLEPAPVYYTQYGGDAYCPHKTDIENAMAEQSDFVAGTQVARALVGVVASLRGQSLRPKGGLYWLAEESLARWSEASSVVDRAGGTIFLLRHIMDEDAVKAVTASVVAEVEDEAAKIELAVASGDLGERATNNKIAAAKALREKLVYIEGILGTSIQSMHDVLDRTELAATTAAMIGGGNAVPAV